MYTIYTHLQPTPYELFIMVPSKFWNSVEWAAVTKQYLHRYALLPPQKNKCVLHQGCWGTRTVSR